ncbi:MAG TPA: efflux transporter outer membrane subunit [Edaphobacter sp.]|jgi:multidrug efflux system outer membrane protein|nr:efflux transporter outer membrane subunit [Edaphobacter sp.]
MMRTKASIGLALLLSLCGCKVGPNYKRPTLDVPGQYRGIAPNLPQQPAGGPFGEMQWPAVYQDEALQALLKEALTNNYDIRIAASRIMQAQASLGVTRANQFPTLGGVGSIQNIQSTPLFTGAPWVDTLGLQMNYIVDFWGQYRRATEAARAVLLSTQYAKNVVQITLISQVATAYFTLRQYDSQLKFSEQTVIADKELLRLNTINFKGGEYSLSDVDQALLLVQQAEAEVISLNQLIPQTENALSILLGRNPGPITRGLELVEQPHLPDVPVGLPSTLLERRPDVRESEETLVAANANVGVAKAAFFPQISLTGTFGASSTALTSFLQGPATFWTVGGQLAQPLYQGGRITSGYRLAWAQRDQAELQYKQTVLQAFGDVANSLVGYTQSRQFRMKIEEQTATYNESARLANVRFTGGYASFLEVLIVQQQYFTSELQLAQAWETEMQNYVQLYQALGGGWQP